MAITNNLYVIAAICGNFWQESTVNPGIWENLTPNSPGYGLGQWTDNPPVVMRRIALFNWLDNNGYSRDSGIGQLNFLVFENSWIVNGAGYTSDYNSLTDFFNSASTDLYYLTYEFFHHWEGIDDGTGNVRYEFAQNVLDRFQNDNGERFPWYTSNSYNSIIYGLRNSMLIKDFFTGTSPEPPAPIEPTDEELIAMFKTALKIKKKNGRGVFIVF